MKVLFVATVRSHIGQFHMPFIRELKAHGAQVDAAFKDNSADKPGLNLSAIDKTFEVPFERQPLRPDNIKAYKTLKKVIDSNNYDAIHCHTPMGAVIARLAAKGARKKGTKVIYTAHGFHFFKGAPLKNWLFFYPVEKYLSNFFPAPFTLLINSLIRLLKRSILAMIFPRSRNSATIPPVEARTVAPKVRPRAAQN